jgi:iron complex outermembrane receptor protein
MIEPGFDNEGDILFRNLTRARIQGLEVNITSPLFAENLILNLGYNYLWAIDVENNVVLKYRPKHTFIAGINFKEEIFEAGIDFRYLSRVEKIDQEFVDLGLVPNGDERVKILVTDARISFNLYHFKIPARISLNAANIFNYYYVELIGNIAPIRNFSLNIEAIF